MSSPLLRRTTLVAQAVALLERWLAEGRWTGSLPSQRELGDELLVSRTTLRAALRQLARRGLLSMGQGRATAIRCRPSATSVAGALHTVVLLLPEPVWALRPSVVRWVSALRAALPAAGLACVAVEGGHIFRTNPAPHLARLAAAHPRAAWIAFGSTLAMQQWFATRGLPVILVGSVFPGIALPSIEYDHAAIAQHAAARLASAGHRRLAILLQRTGSAADATTCDAFAAARPAGAPPPLVLAHGGAPAEIDAQLVRLARLRPAVRPTALFITKSYAASAALTCLPRLGLRIPEDISVICREDDPFVHYLTPAVARYNSDSSLIARKLGVALARLAAGQPLPLTHERLMPRLVPGASIAPPAAV
jgi:DNA-binding LacI/PurR family transcriptional regulator